ncbi:MAG: SDR family oxidoreductase [Candidatus Doudnabacteria bacterium]|nr:SDR family oxidoreductase [Candidatus Doudnabacteria bacterium]
MTNKTILISGGTTGIGKATALKMLSESWNVSVFSNEPKVNQEFIKEAKTVYSEDRFLVLRGDMLKEASLKKIVKETLKKFKRIDALFNNAGIGYFVEADKVNIEKFDKMMEVNIVGMAALTKAVVPIMKKQKSGQIINTASVAGKVGHAKSEFYAASKSAVLKYSEGLRQELQKNSIKVATICPGMVNTHFWTKKEYNRRKKENWHGKDPVRLSVEDIARVVSFICNQAEHSDIQDITIMPI